MRALREIIASHKAGRLIGIASVCSAHPLVIEAALREASRRGDPLLIEATSNQVNQFGGYSGMTPQAFRGYVEGIAARAGVERERILLGGDHLGPNCWRSEKAAEAMRRSEQLIRDYVLAGFRKIHLDCSMSCAGDPPILGDELVAQRAARLCAVAERAWRESGGEPPVYVIGTEVPTPGGAAESLHELAVTTPMAVTQTLEAHRSAFRSQGLADAWQRVVALVVQPGVEFDHHQVIDYRPARAGALSQRIESEPGLVYEAHSTDYQTPASLRALVTDHFAILKVGPAATFALREALWALAEVARELGVREGVQLKEQVLGAMRAQPKYWQDYYTDAPRAAFDMQYSLSDRVRYYWTRPEVAAACKSLFERLSHNGIPPTLLSQYLPQQFEEVRAGRLSNQPEELAMAAVSRLVRNYLQACRPA